MTIPFYMILLFLLLMIGTYNWVYTIRMHKVMHQLHVALPGISIALLKIGTFFVVFSFGVIAVFALFTK